MARRLSTFLSSTPLGYSLIENKVDDLIKKLSFHQLSNFWVSLKSAYLQHLVFVLSLQRHVVSRKTFNCVKTNTVFFSLSRFLIVLFYSLPRPDGDGTTSLSGLVRSTVQIQDNVFGRSLIRIFIGSIGLVSIYYGRLWLSNRSKSSFSVLNLYCIATPQ